MIQYCEELEKILIDHGANSRNIYTFIPNTTCLDIGLPHQRESKISRSLNDCSQLLKSGVLFILPNPIGLRDLCYIFHTSHSKEEILRILRLMVFM